MKSKVDNYTCSKAYTRKQCVVFLFVFALITPYTLRAQLSDSLKKHVIIAFDRYPENEWGYLDILENNHTKITTALHSVLDTLLVDNDYYSVVTYSLGDKDKNIQSYTTCSTSWQAYSSFDKDLNDSTIWNHKVLQHINEGNPFSLNLGAKFFSLHSLFNKNGKNYANKTYMVVVSDNYYNGGDDYEKEFRHVRNPYIKEKNYRDSCLVISSEYLFKPKGSFNISSYSIDYPYHCALYEIVPSSSFTLNSILDYPANMGLKRIKGGYRVSFNYRNIADGYILRKLTATVLNKNDLFVASYVDEGLLSIDIPSNMVREGEEIEISLKGWLEQKNSIYSGLILNPNDENFKKLSITQTLKLRTETKIFGVIPLFDSFWWWCDEEIEKAVIIWDIVLSVVLLFLLIGIISFVGYKLFYLITSYTPKNENINVQHL